MLQLDQQSYRFPASHVRSATDEGHRFVRIKPPEARFELVYDSRIAGSSDPDGWPLVFSLNGEGTPNVERHAFGELKVVCRRAVNPRNGCGIEIHHRGSVWNALFPRKHMLQARRIERQAHLLLENYAA